MNIKYGSPTFIFRNECENNLLGIMADIAKRGFDGIELFGMFGVEPNIIRKKCDEINLVIMGNHIPYNDFVIDTKRIIDDHVILGTKYITIDNIPEDKIPGTNGFSETTKQIERIGNLCKQAGMQLQYHNQGFDLIQKVDGKHMLEVLLDAVSSECLTFQPDLGWIALGGGDPEYFLEKYRDRCPVIHLKDYYATGPLVLGRASELGFKRGGEEYNNFEFRPTGYGIMNFPRLMPKVLACNPEWIVADHDLSYDSDGMDDLEASLKYVKKLVTLY